MLILPDRRISHSKYLMPMWKKEWREPSDFRQPYGVPRRLWRVQAYDKGVQVWEGEFRDRDDLDAFMYAYEIGTLHLEKALWELPTPAWYPYSVPLLMVARDYSYYTTVGNNSWPTPQDWNNYDNVWQAIGGGYQGAGGTYAYGGGGGAYAKSTNITLTRGATQYSYVGYASGVGRTGTGSPGSGDTFLNLNGGGTYPFLANGAGHNSAYYLGGYAAYCSYNYTATNGGNGSTVYGLVYSNGGGGAGGEQSAGSVGSYGGAFSNCYGGAGNGGYSSGGAAGYGVSAGGTGYNIDAYIGSGGGGGGCSVNGYPGGSGGYYGGGGGNTYNSSPGVGIQGVMRVDYRPVRGGFNSPMLGM